MGNPDDEDTDVQKPRTAKRKGREVTTTNGQPPAPGFEDAPAPQPQGADGQHGAYWVLTAEERGKGFVRPVRNSYRHVGPPLPTNLRDLTDEEKERHAGRGYVKFEEYPESERPSMGRYWTAEQLDKAGKGCGTITTMGPQIAETYAAQPDYYGSTFCVSCRQHLPVGKAGEFIWVDGMGRDTTERVGT